MVSCNFHFQPIGTRRKMSSVSEMLVQLRSSDFLVPAVITFVILLVTTILLFVYRRLSTKPSTVLLVGLNDSGKTAMLTKLIDSSKRLLLLVMVL